jgi:serine/threonine protein kinase
MSTTPGTDVLLGGRYRLVSRIAAGGMGEVWSATDELLARNVAVKVLRREYADDPEFLLRFHAEARHTAALSHPGIAAVYDYDDGSATDGGEATPPFLVMENVPGEPLSALLAREGALSEDRTLDVIGQAALALQAAHDAGVIHRDIKPGNILLRPDGVVKITDFGISRATNSVPLTATGAIMGTAFYLAPEQALGQPTTPASDVYSLGVVAYECLTGARPFPGETPVGVALAQVQDQPPPMGGGVRAAVASLVLRMLAKDPADRPDSAGALALEALAVRAGADQPLSETLDVHATSDQPLAETRTLLLPPGSNTDSDPPRLTATRSRRWVISGAGLLVCALVLLLAVRSCSNNTPGSSTSSTSSTASQRTSATTPETVLVRAADYVGKPAAEATAALRALGLRVTSHTVPAGHGMEIGTVTGVTPTGRLSPGESVTLDIAGRGKGDKPPGQKKKDERKQGNP